MSKTILITLNNSGGDPGPYNLTLIDGAGNETVWPSNPVSKAQITTGYQMVVPDLIVKVKVQSKTCTTYVLLTIPTTQCPCRVVNFTQGVYRFYTCGSTIATELNVTGGVLSYCIDTLKGITKISGTGNYTDTNQCCTPGVNPVPTPTTTTTTSTTTTSSTTTSSTTTSTTSTSTTTTCNPGQLIWSINDIVGARIKITRVSDSALLINQVSQNGVPHSGLINNNAQCTSYVVEASWVSGSGNPIKMRICDITNGTQYSFDSGSGPGTNFTRELTICCGHQYSVSVTAGSDTPFICPV